MVPAALDGVLCLKVVNRLRAVKFHVADVKVFLHGLGPPGSKFTGGLGLGFSQEEAMSLKNDWVLLLVLLVAVALILAGVGGFIADRGSTEFWVALGSLGQYVEAVVVTLSAVAIYRQYRRWKEESSAHSFQGFKFIQEVFESERFQRSLRILRTGGSILAKDTENGKMTLFRLSTSVPFVLAQLDMVEFFTGKRFIDREVLLEYGAMRINEIAVNLDNLVADESGGGGEWVADAIKLRPRAEKLLNQAREYWSKKSID